MKVIIKFRNQQLNEIRSCLLKDLSHEYYGALFGKTNYLDNGTVIITVHDFIPYEGEYKKQTIVSIGIDPAFRGYCFEKLSKRVDVDTFIDLHTHPFSAGMPHFSGVDDDDEIGVLHYLSNKKTGFHYASIVLSQDEYEARLWDFEHSCPVAHPAIIRTQKLSELIPSDDDPQKNGDSLGSEQKEMFNRSILALGVSTMKQIMSNQVVTIVGTGGVGSIIAENLIHSGFQNINLIDFDKVEMSNLNRLVGATYQDALNGTLKVEAIRRHLLSINPHAHIHAYANDLFDSKMEAVVALSDWVFMTTDNYKSCVRLQDLCFKYYVPFISAATNIVVENESVEDVRGEVILVRIGDGHCLSCLGKIDKNELEYENMKDPIMRKIYVQHGYVRGADVKDPAVKTLNGIVSNIATEILVNQYTERNPDQFVIEYTYNQGFAIYEDTRCMDHRTKNCCICGE